jgi:hypothetical protein
VTYKILIVGSPTLDYINGKLRAGGPGLYGGLAAKALGCEVYVLGPLGVEDIGVVRVFEYLNIKFLGPLMPGCGPRFKHVYYKNKRVSTLLCKPSPLSYSHFKIVNDQNFDALVLSPVHCEILPSLISWIYSNLSLSPTIIDLQGFIRCYDGLWRSVLQVFKTFYHVSADDLKEPLEVKRGIIGYTLGPEGGYIIEDERIVSYLPKVSKEFEDPTGAGDIFSTTFICNYLKYKDYVYAFKEAANLTERILPLVNKVITKYSTSSLQGSYRF